MLHNRPVSQEVGVASSGAYMGTGCVSAGETMISGYTGEAFRTDIFIGPVYYQRLRHMVSDKFQVSVLPSVPTYNTACMN